MCFGTPTYSCCRSSYSLIPRRRGRLSCTATTRFLERGAKAARLGNRGALTHGIWPIPAKMTPPFVVAPDGEIVRVVTGEQEHQHQRRCRLWGMEVLGSHWRRALPRRCRCRDPDRDRMVLGEPRQREEDAVTISVESSADEYDETVDDNATLKCLAQWNLEVGEEVTRLVAERWPEQWRALSRRLVSKPRSGANGCRWRACATLDRRVDGGLSSSSRLFGLGDRSCRVRGADRADGRAARPRAHQRSKTIKQADGVDAATSPLPSGAPRGPQGEFRVLRATLRTWQTAQPVTSRAAAARLAMLRWRALSASSESIVGNMGNAVGGVHVGALGGPWQAGCSASLAALHRRGPSIAATCGKLRSLSMRFQWRGRWHEAVTLPESDAQRRRRGMIDEPVNRPSSSTAGKALAALPVAKVLGEIERAVRVSCTSANIASGCRAARAAQARSSDARRPHGRGSHRGAGGGNSACRGRMEPRHRHVHTHRRQVGKDAGVARPRTCSDVVLSCGAGRAGAWFNRMASSPRLGAARWGSHHQCRTATCGELAEVPVPNYWWFM